VKEGGEAMNTTTTTEPTTFRADRFRKVIESVEAAPEKTVNMDYLRMDRECGSVCCAFGHYVLRHPEEGVSFTPPVADECMFGIHVPDSDGIYWEEKIAAHLGITNNDVEYLFSPDSYDDPCKSEVLARLREFAADHRLTLK
jgi:hypothetical protein